MKSRWLQLLQDQSLVSYFVVSLTLAQEFFILNQIHGMSNSSLKIKDSSTYVSSDNSFGLHCFCHYWNPSHISPQTFTNSATCVSGEASRARNYLQCCLHSKLRKYPEYWKQLFLQELVGEMQ